MPGHPLAAVRLCKGRLHFTVVRDDGGLQSIELSVSPETAHVLHHVLVTHLDPESGRRRPRATRPAVLERSLRAIGGAVDRIEVRAGEPPAFELVVVACDGTTARIDLDLVDATELIAGRGIPVVATGWPETDWDGELVRLMSGS